MHDPLAPATFLATAAYTLFGAVVFALAFVAMFRLSPIPLKKELEDDQNVAVAIVMGSVILGLAWVIGAAVGA